jgi:hypothetical protein
MLTLRSEDRVMKARLPFDALVSLKDSLLPADSKGRIRVKDELKLTLAGGLVLYIWTSDYLKVE